MSITTLQLLETCMYIIGLTTIILFVSRLLLAARYDTRAPTVVSQTIPLVGHLINVLRYGFEYFEDLAADTKLPIFTLRILAKDVHIINSPDLVVAVQKNPKIFDFTIFVNTILPRLFNVDRKTMEIMTTPMDLPEGSWDLFVETSRIMHRCLGSGSSSLEKMEHTALDRFLHFFDELESGPDDIIIDLFAWLRTATTVASTEAIYGPANPFSHQPELEYALWVWENDLTRMLLAPFPSIIARNGFHGRAQVVAAMTNYIDRKGYERASDLAKARHDAGVKWGLSNGDIARLELGSIMGVLVNSAPTLFWLLVHIYSDPGLLASLREEASSAISHSHVNDGEVEMLEIDITTWKQKFPLLLSAYQETLRLRTHNTASRMVTQDTILAGTHFLRAGSIVQMPGACIHSLPSIWGTDHASFNAYRFLKSAANVEKETSKEQRKQHPGAFRSFGGGTSLCPGRHFATTEICAVAAMFIMRFNMAKVDKNGVVCEWQLPVMQVGRITSAIPLPKEDIRVKLTRRYETINCTFQYAFKDGL